MAGAYGFPAFSPSGSATTGNRGSGWSGGESRPVSSKVGTHREAKGEKYRSQPAGEHPVRELRGQPH
ncbi:hypothetical protein SAMN05661077_2500 [Thiohalorhabdus denitrificans]|uniref:Uncharacterized protein n=1 Tax=Thiohalorhabdus denitrificans TaxID=381306 RepID=A0A1G5GZT9_9GAMM|nr:hypothetical protein SAMN05661077_2500 [Thiohalorhabdus denitrificans]